MRVLYCDNQPSQSSLQEIEDYRKEEEALAKLDVDYLIACLSMDRNTHYRIKGRPDSSNRQSPQPDYLIEEVATGNLITIEHSKFFESEEVRKKEATLVKELDAHSDRGAVAMFPNHFPTPEALGERLSAFLSDKLSKGQFKDFRNTERILLAKNRWGGVHIDRFKEAEPHLKLPKPLECDHFYVIFGPRYVYDNNNHPRLVKNHTILEVF